MPGYAQLGHVKPG